MIVGRWRFICFANVRDDGSPLAFGAKACSAAEMPKAPKVWWLSASACSDYFEVYNLTHCSPWTQIKQLLWVENKSSLIFAILDLDDPLPWYLPYVESSIFERYYSVVTG